MDDVPLVEAVEAVDRQAALRTSSRTATLVVAEINPRTGLLSYVTAGHPRPLVVGVEGQTTFLDPSGAGPLGSGSSFEAASAHLRDGEMVVLYTDGAVERFGRRPVDGANMLADVVSDTYLDRALTRGAEPRASARVTRTGLELLAGHAGHRDDITLLAAQRVPAIVPLSLEMPAEPAAVSRCRLELAGWLEQTGTRSLDAMALQHAVGEMVDNAVRHAYGDALAAKLDRSAICVDARLLPSGEAEVVVADHGSWRTPTARGGRGLAMARGFMDVMEVDRGSHGTRVTFRHRLTRPAGITASRNTSPRDPGALFGIDIELDEVSVHGDVDARSVDELRVTLDRATHGRTSAVTIDLTAVTRLGGPGVQLLFELLRDAPDTALVAREGSLADHVLDVAQLAHAT
jgi:anti-sigma regulatory factor (Ser/Thr protein kinase)